MIIKGYFPFTWFFISHGEKFYETVDGPKYYVLPIPNRGLKILINAEFKIASDQLPFIERQRNY